MCVLGSETITLTKREETDEKRDTPVANLLFNEHHLLDGHRIRLLQVLLQTGFADTVQSLSQELPTANINFTRK